VVFNFWKVYFEVLLMCNIRNKIIALFVLTLVIMFSMHIGKEVKADPKQKRDPAFASFGAGYYDFNRKKETGA